MAKKTHDISECLSHFSPGISPDIDEYAQEEALAFSRYIFTTRQGKKRFGYCTHCGGEFLIKPKKRKPKPVHPRPLIDILTGPPEPDHNEPARMRCPLCKSMCWIKASGRSRKHLVDEVYFVYYEKSLIDQSAIVARGFHAMRDYRGNYKDVKTQYSIKALYLFKMGDSVMFKKEFTRWDSENNRLVYEWNERGSAHSIYPDQWDPEWQGYQKHPFNKTTRTFISQESIAQAVSRTPFQYSTWEDYSDDSTDMVKFFELYSKYPCIEYLTKLGFEGLVHDKLRGFNTYRSINWRGKNPLQVLKLSKQDLKGLRAQDIEVTFSYLSLLQGFRKSGIELTFAEIAEIDKAGYYQNDYNQRIFKEVLAFVPVRQAHKYFKRQVKKGYCSSYSYALTTWKDYIADCKKLDMDLTNMRVIFPKNLHTAHQNTIKQIKIIADEVIDKKITANYEGLLAQYYFEHKGLLIRPARNTQELIDEGKALTHCVGGYAEGYADGRFLLLFIRYKSRPNKPFFTMEIQKNRIVQCQGLENCFPNEKVKAFIEAFKKAKLQDKKVEARIQVPA